MSRKIFDSNLKSLIHFNFPYDDEPNAGLRDEFNNLKFFHIADDDNFFDDTNPKFGWRCQSVDCNRWLRALNQDNLLNLNPNSNYEFSFFAYFDNAQDRWGVKTFNNHSYCDIGSQSSNSIATSMIAFDAMKDYSALLNAHLATISNENELNFIFDAMYGKGIYSFNSSTKAQNTPGFLTIGAYRDDIYSPYVWINGDDNSFINSLVNEGSLVQSDAPSRSPEEQQLFLVLCPNDGKYVIDNAHLRTVGNSGKSYPAYIMEWDYLHLDGNILNLKNQFLMHLDDDNKLCLSVPNWGINATSENSVTTDVWSHVIVRISNGYVKVFINAVEVISAQIDNNASSLNPEFIELGGYTGLLDEFAFYTSASDSTPVIPASPLKADFNISSINGFGEGIDGEFVPTQNMNINSYAIINSIDGNTLTVGAWASGTFTPEVGREVMIHVAKRKDSSFYDINADNFETVNANEKAGLFFFDRIYAINDNVITLQNLYTTNTIGLNSDLLNDYFVQIITVPNFLDVNITEKSELYPLSWSDSSGGGIVVFKSNGNVAVQGYISTEGTGPQRHDLFLMNNYELAERFLIGSGGGVFIACAKTIITTDNAVLGGSWGADRPNNQSQGYAGYGGAGLKSDGKVNKAGAIGYGGNGSNASGGRPGFNGDDYNASFKGGNSGACLYIVAGRAAIAYNSFSTGGDKGNKYSGGGGSGFGYVAAKILG